MRVGPTGIGQFLYFGKFLLFFRLVHEWKPLDVQVVVTRFVVVCFFGLVDTKMVVASLRGFLS